MGGGKSKTTSEQPTDRRIVLLGKTGTGKSSLANTIFGETVFKTDETANAGTSKCAGKTRFINGRSITLIDTPGFFDPDKSKEGLKNEIVKCLAECPPGPHAFLILLKVEKFTDHEKQVIDEILNNFSEEAFKHAAVVFTHGEQLPEGKKIEDFVKKNKGLSDLVQKCGGRCHVIDNKYWKNKQCDKYRHNQFQVKELLNTIDKIVEENNGGYYNNEVLQTVEKEIQKEVEHIILSSGHMTWEKITKLAKANVLKKLLIRLAGTTTGVVLGAILGVPRLISLVMKALTTTEPAVVTVAATAVKCAVETAVGVAGAAAVTTGLGIAVGCVAAAGAVEGGFIGYHEADQADSVGEAIKRAAKAVCDNALPSFQKTQFNKKQQ